MAWKHGLPVMKLKYKMEEKSQVSCLFCEFKTKTNESLKQHINSKHEEQASSYDEAMKMLESPAIESMLKTVQNLQKEKEAKEHLIKNLENNLQAAQDQLEFVNKYLEEKSHTLEKAKRKIIKEINKKKQEFQWIKKFILKRNLLIWRYQKMVILKLIRQKKPKLIPVKKDKICIYFKTVKS